MQIISTGNISKTSSKQRFASLDGLRALAALGVLWIHCWSSYGAPRFIVYHIDIASIAALGGNGVDLFFVISGFCMYYFYGAGNHFTYDNFWGFIKKRWIRLSPAFYTASAVYIYIAKYHDPNFSAFKSGLVSLLYLNGLINQNVSQSILWTLTVEWQFYLVIPFLLIYQRIKGFSFTFWLIGLSFFFAAILSTIFLKDRSDLLTNQLVFRYAQFMCGILAARLFLLYPQFQTKHRWIYAVAFIIIMYAGRICISHQVLSLSPNYYNIFKLIGFTVMCVGFGGITYLSLTSTGCLKKVLGNQAIAFIGKISFSFYLWHPIVHIPIGNFLVRSFGPDGGIRIPLINFVLSIIILIPLSTLSFYLLENRLSIGKKTK